MVVERRVFNRLPCYLQTDQNNRDTYISDDVMFEPERAGFVNAYIGDVSPLTDEDLERTPQLSETSAERQKYQLSLGAVFIDPDTDARSDGAFYPDLVRQIFSNGGITTDPNRLFETPFYAWSPPIDYDKHINFTRYYWTGAGNAEVNGEYVTKEPEGSQTTVYKVVANEFVAFIATISSTPPVGPSVGDLWEDTSDINRVIFQWDGASWIGVAYFVIETLPADTSAYINGDFVYPSRTGPGFNRPLAWKYATEAGRWIALPIVVGPLPDRPVEGMIWEDSTIPPNRIIKIFQNGFFDALNPIPQAGPAGIVADNTYIYDTRQVTEITDGWSSQNLWRHFDDLSPADREALLSGDQAVRPIVEFWSGLESVVGDTKDFRNDAPVYQVYQYVFTTDEIVNTGQSTTLFQYQIGTGLDDQVLGFPLSFNDTGEFLFELTLETDTLSGVTGYRYFKDVITGLTHSIWAKSDINTVQEIDSDGLAEVPVNITSNADHEILTIASRSRMLRHMSGVIGAQEGLSGSSVGANSFRWSDKSPTRGATIIDTENSLLRTMAILQRPTFSVPDSIRRISRDYNRVLVKFNTRLSQLWDDLTLADPTGTLLVTPSEAVDAVLTELFVGRNKDFSYFYSDMGTYVETQVDAGVAVVIGTGTKPIFIPPSPPRTGAGQTYRPERFTDRDGSFKLRGHEGVIIDAYQDDRDDVWLELQTRFFNQIPDYYKEESIEFSARHVSSNFWLQNYYGNSIPTTTVDPVDQVVPDHTTIPAPAAGTVVFSTQPGVFAYYDGAKFETKPALVDDVFFNRDDEEYYIYNGFGGFLIDRFERPFDFDYSQEEYRQILRREFERWAVFLEVDFISNDGFIEGDPFTWNYRSSGVEGHYQGIYLRLYRSIRPHSHPWEIVGYSTKPDWWEIEYVPSSTAADGTPRYDDTHAMWTDLQAGVFNASTGAMSDQHVMAAPIPVDSFGELLDPIAAGIVDEDKLVPDRRDDTWVYGDGAPVEQDFFNSPVFSFSIALQGYLMKPGIFVDTLWSELYIDVGTNGANPLWRAPHVVHRDTLTRPSVNDLPVHLEIVDGVVEQRLGVNAWISEFVSLLGNDVTTSFGDVIRNTSISVGWRCAGFVNRDRTIVQTLAGVKIPFEDVHTLLHRSPPANESFGSGVLIIREGENGYRVFGFDLFRPFFEIDVPVVPITGGQVELREDITATQDQHTFTTTNLVLPRNVQDNETAKLSVLVNGLRLKPQHITVIDKTTLEIEAIVTINIGDVVTPVTLTTPSNPSTRIKQFQISGVSFPYIDAGQGLTSRVEYGRFFGSSSDVINFMLAYGRKLEAEGWVFDNEVIDEVKTPNWLDGAKQFATWVLDTKSPWLPDGPDDSEEFLFSPFSRIAKFQSDFGQVLNVEALQNGAYGILDNTASPIDPEGVFTSRIGNEIVLKPNDGVANIYGIRILLAEDQHVVFFSNTTKFNDLIYDPIIALFQSTLRLDTYRSLGWNGRLEADGFVINQGEILPNFEKQAKDFIKYYDRIDTLDDPVKRDQARELYGWYPNDEWFDVRGLNPVAATQMMDAIGADDRSRFDFHRGMLHTKGTIRPIIAFARGTRVGRDNVLINEDWAWRWCEFGDTRRLLVQFSVGKNDFRDQVQVFEFNIEDNLLDSIVQVPEFDRSVPNEGRWIIPPIIGADDQCCSYTFPVDQNGLFDPEKIKFHARLFDTETNTAVLRMFQYDPDNGLYDPRATCEIDYTSHLDPARYSDGAGAAYSNNSTWGEAQVGEVWWDQSRLVYTDFRGQAPDYLAVASEWGKLKYFRGTITRNEQIVTIETTDAYTQAVVPHDLSTGDEIVISGAIPTEYNGTHVITVTSPTTVEYQIDQAVDSPATGDIKIRVGFVDVVEWIKSPVTPKGWNNHVKSLKVAGSPSGQPMNGDDTSYVTRQIVNSNGSTTFEYFFWIINNMGDNLENNETTAQIAMRLFSPTITGNPWFSVIDTSRMLMFIGSERAQDNYAIELLQDQRELDHHTEWLLISEGDQFISVPSLISDKILDSMASEDDEGREVPSTLLADTEKYGSDTFPTQTVYVDRAEAIQVFVTAINTIMNRKNLDSNITITGIFPLADENTYWVRANFLEEEREGVAVLDTVSTEAVRLDRLEKGRYFNGDLVTVVQSGGFDLWDDTSEVSATYVLTDGNFIEVGVNNQTVNIILDDTTDPTVLRSTFEKVYALLDKVEQNELIFVMLYEMMRQTPDADWFMKTSYITAQIFDDVSQSPFVRPNEVEAVLAATLDLKPYRTKLRSSTLTYTIAVPEEMIVRIDEFPDKKISIWFDRLNCDAIEDGGWDGFPWDTEHAGWDKPIWDWEDLGRELYHSLGVQVGVTILQTYTFASPYDPTLYDHKIILRQNNLVVNPADLGLVVLVLKNHINVMVEFSGTLSPEFSVEVQQTSGFYQGGTPTLGPDFTDTLFQAAPSSYKHHVPRSMEAGLQAPFDSMDECYTDPPTDPQERISNDTIDSLVICVKNFYTAAYAGWDTTPWDSTGWDLPPNDIGVRVFYQAIGNEVNIPAGLVVFSTSEDVVSTDPVYVIASQVYRIADVAVNGMILQRGVEYDLVTDAPWAAEFFILPDISFLGDGITITFDVSAATTGVADVYRNDVLLTDTVDYNIVGNDLVFVQPPPTLLPINSITLGRDYISNGIRTEYETGHNGNSISLAATFIFNDGDLVDTGDYQIGPTEDVEFTVAPAVDNLLLFWTIGNDIEDSTPLFTEFTDTGTGAISSYIVGGNANLFTAYVFLDNRYQVLGTDYTIPAIGTIQFTSPVPAGVEILIRNMPPSSYVAYDMDHVVFTASGTPSDIIPGISDADPDRMLVFVGDEPQNGYSSSLVDFTLTNGTPDDIINWVVAPLVGTQITIRFIRTITIDEAVVINVLPNALDTVRVVPNPIMEVNDTITFYYDQFPVGPLGPFTVTGSSVTYDIQGGFLTIDNIFLNGFVNLTYTEDRRGDNARSILVRMTNVVDLARSDHLTFDPTLGFEDNRNTPLRILNTTNDTMWHWDGTDWIPQTVVFVATDQVLARQDQQILEFDGTDWNVVFNTGDAYTTPPVLPYPLWGNQVVSGTYALGQTALASADFPVAFQINLHPGDCTGENTPATAPPPPPAPPPAVPVGSLYSMSTNGFTFQTFQRHDFESGSAIEVLFTQGPDGNTVAANPNTYMIEWANNKMWATATAPGVGGPEPEVFELSFRDQGQDDPVASDNFEETWYFIDHGRRKIFSFETGGYNPVVSMFEYDLDTLDEIDIHDLSGAQEGAMEFKGLDQSTGYLVGGFLYNPAGGEDFNVTVHVYDPETKAIITEVNFLDAAFEETPSDFNVQHWPILISADRSEQVFFSSDFSSEVAANSRTNIHTFPGLVYVQRFEGPEPTEVEGTPSGPKWQMGTVNARHDSDTAWVMWESFDNIEPRSYKLNDNGTITTTIYTQINRTTLHPTDDIITRSTGGCAFPDTDGMIVFFCEMGTRNGSTNRIIAFKWDPSLDDGTVEWTDDQDFFVHPPYTTNRASIRLNNNKFLYENTSGDLRVLDLKTGVNDIDTSLGAGYIIGIDPESEVWDDITGCLYSSFQAGTFNVFEVAGVDGVPTGEILYATDGAGRTDSYFYSINTSTGEAEIRGILDGIGFQEVVSMAFHPITGICYGISNIDNKELITIDTTTGAGTLVAAITGLPNKSVDMTFRADGTLFCWDSVDADLYMVNTVTAVCTLVGVSGITGGQVGLAYDNDGVLWMKDGLLGNLYTINDSTGVATLDQALGTGGTGLDNALTFDNNNQGWSIDRQSFDSFLYTFDTSDATGIEIGEMITFVGNKMASLAFGQSTIAAPVILDDFTINEGTPFTITADEDASNDDIVIDWTRRKIYVLLFRLADSVIEEFDIDTLEHLETHASAFTVLNGAPFVHGLDEETGYLIGAWWGTVTEVENWVYDPATTTLITHHPSRDQDDPSNPSMQTTIDFTSVMKSPNGLVKGVLSVRFGDTHMSIHTFPGLLLINRWDGPTDTFAEVGVPVVGVDGEAWSYYTYADRIEVIKITLTNAGVASQSIEQTILAVNVGLGDIFFFAALPQVLHYDPLDDTVILMHVRQRSPQGTDRFDIKVDPSTGVVWTHPFPEDGNGNAIHLQQSGQPMSQARLTGVKSITSLTTGTEVQVTDITDGTTTFPEALESNEHIYDGVEDCFYYFVEEALTLTLFKTCELEVGGGPDIQYLLEFDVPTLTQIGVTDLSTVTTVTDGQFNFTGIDPATGYLIGTHEQTAGVDSWDYIINPNTMVMVTEVTNVIATNLLSVPYRSYTVITDTGSGNAAVLSASILEVRAHTFPALASQNSWDGPNPALLYMGGPDNFWNTGPVSSGASGEGWGFWVSPDEIRVMKYAINGAGVVTETEEGTILKAEVSPEEWLHNDPGQIVYYNEDDTSLLFYQTKRTSNDRYLIKWSQTTGLVWATIVPLIELAGDTARHNTLIDGNDVVLVAPTSSVAYKIDMTTGVITQDTLGATVTDMESGSGVWHSGDPIVP